MDIYIEMIIFLIMMHTCSHAFLRVKYKTALKNSKKHVNYVIMFNELTSLKFRFDKSAKLGLFDGAPTVLRYLKSIDYFFYNEISRLSTTKLIPQRPGLVFLEELKTLDERELEILVDYSKLLSKLHKVNEPFKHLVLSVKKILLARILRFIITLITTMFKAVEMSERLGNGLKKFINRSDGDTPNDNMNWLIYPPSS